MRMAECIKWLTLSDSSVFKAFLKLNFYSEVLCWNLSNVIFNIVTLAVSGYSKEHFLLCDISVVWAKAFLYYIFNIKIIPDFYPCPRRSEQLWVFFCASPGWEVVRVSARFASWVSAWGVVFKHVLPGGDPKAKPKHNWEFKPLIFSISSSKIEEAAEKRMVWSSLLKLLSPQHLRTTNHSWYHDVIFMKSIFWTTGTKKTDWFFFLFIAHKQKQHRDRHTPTSPIQTRIPCSECEVDETS